MIKWKKIFAFVLAVILTTGTFADLSLAAEGADTGDRFYYDGVKYKTSRTATANEVFQDSRNGLLLYSYDSGTKATFRETFSGDFSIETKAIGSKKKSYLSSYALHFTEVTTGETFSVNINDTGTEIQASVSVGEDTTGIYYETKSTWDNNAHGYTTIMNQNDKYTTVIGASTATIIFNPDTMELKIKKPSDQEEYKTIWCLTEEIMDGKRFSHVLRPFDKYNVAIEFTAVSEGKKGELLIYNVNGEDYGKPNLPYVQSMIDTNLITYAVAGCEYTLPKASVYGVADEKINNEITCTIFDAAGNELASGKVADGLAFVPEAAGTYYLYYKLTEKLSAENYVKLVAYSQENLACNFEEYNKESESVGIHSTWKIPARSVESELLMEGEKLYADVTIKHGDKVVEEKKQVKKDFKYTFEEAGTYTINWNVTLFDKTFEDSVSVTVDEKIPSIVGAEFKSSYDMGSTLKIPKATIYVGGKDYDAKAQVITPSGDVVEEKEMTLDEIGNYRVVYTYKVGSESNQFERAFKVDYHTSKLFEAGEDTVVYYDDTTGNAEMPGVQIEMSSNSSSATYVKTLDLSDNTKHDTLIELYNIPSKIGANDLTGFYITLTDKLDPDNYVTVRAVSDSTHACYLRAKASEQPGFVGLWKKHNWDQAPYVWEDSIEDTMAHDKSGFLAYFDMAYNLTEYDLADKTFILRYDANEKAIYSHNLFELVHDENYRENLVVDLDDPTMFTSLWKGFTDDSQVELSITPMAVSGTATFKIMNVDGENLGTENLADTTAPKVTVDYLGMEGAPNGKVGLAYPIFDLILEDDLCSQDSLVVTTTVTHNGEELKVKEGAFTPEKAGLHQIKYVVSDGFGNTTEQLVDVMIEAEIPDVAITMNSEFSEKISYGIKCQVPDFAGDGGSGKLTYRTYYIHDKKETEFTGSFIPMDEGEFTVVCEVKDYLGQVAKESKTYQLEFEPEMILDEEEIVLPSMLIADKTFEFEKYTANYYEKVGADAKKATCTIEVTDAEGTRTLEKDRIYVPKMSESVKEAKITFVFKAEVDGKEIKKEVERTVSLHSVGTTDKFVADYFVGENAQFNVYNRYMTIRTANADSDAKVQFIRPIQVRNFNMALKANADENGNFASAYERLRVTLTDKENINTKVQFDVIQNGTELKMSINGDKEVLMPGTLSAASQENVVIAYNNDSLEVLGTENALLGKVKEFEGFGSGEAYLTIEFVGVTGASAIDLISINNQTFLSTVQDNTNPELFVNGSYSGLCAVGDEITIPTADAYDVLNYVSKPTVTILAPDGSEAKAEDGTVLKNVPANKEYRLRAEQLGQYTITYSAKDEAGRMTDVSKTYSAFDDELPTVKLKGKFPKSVKAGKDVKVKRYKIEDNGDKEKVKVELYYGTPGGLLEKVEGKKIPTEEKGTYYVYFYLTDENGNNNVQTFTFEAR